VSADLKTQYLAGPATIAELKERAAKEGGSVLDYLGVLRSILMGAITASAEAQSAHTVANLSGRLVDVLREIGRLTGEIERMNPGVTINNNLAILAQPQMVELQSGLLAIARQHPDVRGPIINLLRSLDTKPATGLAGGLPAPMGSVAAGEHEIAAHGLPMAPSADPPIIECEPVDAT
jgi:hypothetical protein